MKVLSLKLKEDVFNEVDRVVKKIRISRNAYINEALEFYNKVQKRRLLSKKLKQESKAVRSGSLEVLHELEKLDDNFV